jgi:hypothetical protein
LGPVATHRRGQPQRHLCAHPLFRAVRVWVVGCGLRVVGCGLWVVGCGCGELPSSLDLCELCGAATVGGSGTETRKWYSCLPGTGLPCPTSSCGWTRVCTGSRRPCQHQRRLPHWPCQHQRRLPHWPCQHQRRLPHWPCQHQRRLPHWPCQHQRRLPHWPCLRQRGVWPSSLQPRLCQEWPSRRSLRLTLLHLYP